MLKFLIIILLLISPGLVIADPAPIPVLPSSGGGEVDADGLDNVFSTTGLLRRTGAATYDTITDGSSNWNDAYTYRLTGASGTSPLNLTLNANSLTGSIDQVDTDTSGYLSFGDWNTFNNKVSSQWATQNTNDVSLAGGNVAIGTTFTTNAALAVIGGNVGIGTWRPAGTLNVVTTPGTNDIIVVNGNVGIGTVSQSVSKLFVVKNNANFNVDNNGTVTFSSSTVGNGNGWRISTTAGSYVNSSATAGSTLTVRGGASASSILNLQSTSASGSGDAIRFVGGPGPGEVARFSGANLGIGTNTPLARLDITSTASQDMFMVNDDGVGDTTPFVITSTGNVGISTTATPRGNLDVAGASVFGSAGATAAPFTVYGGASGSDLVRLIRTVGATVTYGWGLSGGGLTFNDVTNSNIVMGLYGGSSAKRIQFGITNDGSAETTDNILAASEFNTTAGTDVPGVDMYIRGSTGTGAAEPGPIIFQLGSSVASGTTKHSVYEPMRLSNTGNLGIGTAIPEASLVVNGLVVVDKVTADPCSSGSPEGAIFYNNTSDYWCGCNGTDDVQLHSPTTACF